MFTEDEFIPISALQHYYFCPRQCALIHVEDAWRENVFTIRGEILHEKVDTDTYESRRATKTVRGLRIHSARLGIVGRADVVEFKDDKPRREVFPVEFKAGEPKDDICDKVQLCAQALCLEEMLEVNIPHGAFFYGKVRRRIVVELDEKLRCQTGEVIAAVRSILSSRTIPTAGYSAKCRHCSLETLCLPKAMNPRKLSMYMKQLFQP